MRRIRRPSPSMVIACVALGVALSGTGIAATVALAPNSVGTPQLKNNAVTTLKVKNGTLVRGDFRAGQIPAGPAGPPGAAGAAGTAGPAGPAGPSDAYARFVNGPVAIPAALTTLANLSIPQAGRYVIWAKASFAAAAQGNATCRLTAGTNFDESQSFTFSGPYGSTLSTIVVNEYAAAGSADFQCQGTGTLTANFIKIAAIKVANLTNSG